MCAVWTLDLTPCILPKFSTTEGGGVGLRPTSPFCLNFPRHREEEWGFDPTSHFLGNVGK
jgi:hypothetical protein